MSEGKNLLVVDDDPTVREAVSAYLIAAGFQVTVSSTGGGISSLVARHDIDLVVLDLGLPDIDGLTVVPGLKEKFDIGVVVLSGRHETTERVIGLEVGADDYLGKPYEPRELLARVRSVLRRRDRNRENVTDTQSVYSFEGWKLNPSKLEFSSPEGEIIKLSSLEFGLLQAFVENPNRVLSRFELLELTHGRDMPAFERSIDVQVTRLRKKLDANRSGPSLIKTLRNRGYMFAGDVQVS